MREGGRVGEGGVGVGVERVGALGLGGRGRNVVG